MLGGRFSVDSGRNMTTAGTTIIAGPLYLHRFGIGIIVIVVTVATMLCMAVYPRSYRAVANVSVTWKKQAASIPDRLSADILFGRLSGDVSAAGGHLAVMPSTAPTIFDITFDYSERFFAAVKLNRLLETVAIDPAADARRDAIARDIDLSEREITNLSSALALTQATRGVALAHTSPDQGGSTVMIATQKLEAGAAAENTSKGEIATDSAARDAAAQNLASLQLLYGPLFPSVIAAKKALESASDALSDAVSRNAAAEAQIKAAQKKLKGARSVEPPPAVNPVNQQFNLLLAKLTAANAAAIDRRVALVDQAKAMASPYPYVVRILRKAEPPRYGEPSSAEIALFGIILAAIAIGLFVLVRELQAKGFRTVRAIESALGVRVVALVPDTGPRNFSTGHDPANLVLDRSDPALTASLQDALHAITDTDRATSGHTIAICSAIPAEGKTTTALCLAREAAISGLRTVVVDCDGRRSILSKALPGQSSAGLVQVLDGSRCLADTLEVDASGAYFIRHSADMSFRDLSDARLMIPVLAELSTMFDLVLLDTAPVIGLAESRVLASLADRVIFIVHWRETARDASRLAMKTLATVDADVVGIIVTRVVVAAPTFNVRGR